MTEPREYTPEEVRSLFLDHVRDLIDYCDRANPSKREALEVLAHSILCAIDGGSLDLPSFELKPSPHPDDKEFCVSEGENWFPDGVDIAGLLAGNLFRSAKD